MIKDTRGCVPLGGVQPNGCGYRTAEKQLVRENQHEVLENQTVMTKSTRAGACGQVGAEARSESIFRKLVRVTGFPDLGWWCSHDCIVTHTHHIVCLKELNFIRCEYHPQ